MHRFFGANPVAVAGTVASILLLLAGLVGQPGANTWLGTFSFLVVATAILILKLQVDRDSKRDADGDDKLRANTLASILSGPDAEVRKTFSPFKRAFGTLFILGGVFLAPILELGLDVPLRGPNFTLMLASSLAAIAAGYELIMRP